MVYVKEGSLFYRSSKEKALQHLKGKQMFLLQSIHLHCWHHLAICKVMRFALPTPALMPYFITLMQSSLEDKRPTSSSDSCIWLEQTHRTLADCAAKCTAASARLRWV